MNDEELRKKFKEMYSKVFDSEGEIKACGRDACYDLIKISDEIEPSISHGNLDSCTMKVKRIQRLYERIKM